MATSDKIPQTGSRQEGTGNTPTGGPAPQVAPQIDERLRQKLTSILGDILTKAQEVGFELATLECPKANECPLVKKSRELITVLKKLFELRKELS